MQTNNAYLKRLHQKYGKHQTPYAGKANPIKSNLSLTNNVANKKLALFLGMLLLNEYIAETAYDKNNRSFTETNTPSSTKLVDNFTVNVHTKYFKRLLSSPRINLYFNKDQRLHMIDNLKYDLETGDWIIQLPENFQLFDSVDYSLRDASLRQFLRFNYGNNECVVLHAAKGYERNTLVFTPFLRIRSEAFKDTIEPLAYGIGATALNYDFLMLNIRTGTVKEANFYF